MGVVPQGGNTGLVAGSVPTRGDEVVLSLRRLNRAHCDEVSGTMFCQAGAILDDCNRVAKAHGLMMPIDLGSSGSCTIGGNLASNAGGVRVVRYGSLRANLVGLEVVLADGTVLDSLGTVRKDNTGYDLKQLFVGSEGTLGVITEAALAAPALPSSVHVALLTCNSYEQVVRTLEDARRELGEILSAAECWDEQCSRFVEEQFPDFAKFGPAGAKFSLLVETHGSNDGHDMEKMSRFVENRQGYLAMSQEQGDSMWAIRESITLALKQKKGVTYKFDVSLPVHLLEQATQAVKLALSEHRECQVLQYGHICEGGLHLNVWCPSGDEAIKQAAQDAIYGFCKENRGSISAEHGIGTQKIDPLVRYKQPEQLDVMRTLKTSLDPNNILNPGKVVAV